MLLPVAGAGRLRHNSQSSLLPATTSCQTPTGRRCAATTQTNACSGLTVLVVASTSHIHTSIA